MRAGLRHRSRRGPPGQRGAALLTAMIIVTLVATLASSMVWQQWRAVQVETAERARAQAGWLLTGAIDWARLLLKEDARNGGADHLGEPWATPLAEARISTFLAADKNSTDDAPEAFLAGAITDAQARFNLTSLVAQGKIDPVALAAFGRLCETTNVAADVAGRIANGLLAAHNAVGLAGVDIAAPILPRSVSQLGWLGIDPETLRLLGPYVVLLPKSTPVNVNTAPREVLVAAIKGLDLASAEHLIQVRQRVFFKQLADVEREVPALAPLDPARLAVASSFFQVRGRIRLGDRVLEQTNLIERRGLDMVVLQRERVSSRDQAAS